MKRALAVFVLLASSIALAQPMMIDPSRMSGIPRPDPQVPAHTITVRLIRGELSNRVIGHDVELIDAQSGAKQTVKTDENGRATFADLGGGPYRARAVDGEQEFVSQPIELPPDIGVRVMLVFPKGGLGEPDGVGHADKAVPPGVVVVRVVGDGGAPLAGVDVVLGHARAGENGVSEQKKKTDDKGEARFEGLDAKPTSGYLAEVVKDGARFSGKPFRLVENMGSTVVLEVRQVSHDVSQLKLETGSHFIFEVNDDAVQVVEMLRLHNPTSAAIDPGPTGLHVPLPEAAVSASAGPQSPQELAVTGHEAIWRGSVPPGDTELQIVFVLAYQGDHVDFVQSTPIPFTDVAVVTEKIDGMSIDGVGIQSEDRELQGRKLVLYRGPGTVPNGQLKLSIVGLPHSDPTWRLVAAGLSFAIVLGFLLWAASGPAPTNTRQQLEAERDRLLAELAAIEARESGGKKKRREELAEALERVYRELDEVSA